MAAPKGLTPERVINALLLHHGGREQAARYLGCNRRTITRYISECPEVKQAATEALETTKDVIEDQLIKAATEGKAWAICFYLKCKAKDRGYIERGQSETGSKGDFDDDEVWGENSMLPTPAELVQRMRTLVAQLDQPNVSNGHAAN